MSAGEEAKDGPARRWQAAAAWGPASGDGDHGFGTLEPRRSLEALIKHPSPIRSVRKVVREGEDLVGLGRRIFRTDPRLVPSTHSRRTHATSALPSGLTGCTDHARVRNYLLTNANSCELAQVPV